jgi:hypothetical protein
MRCHSPPAADAANTIGTGDADAGGRTHASKVGRGKRGGRSVLWQEAGASAISLMIHAWSSC